MHFGVSLYCAVLCCTVSTGGRDPVVSWASVQWQL